MTVARAAQRKERRNTSLKKTVALTEEASEHDTPIRLPSIKLKKTLEGGLLKTAPRPPRVAAIDRALSGKGKVAVDTSTSAQSLQPYSDKASVAKSADRRADR